MRQILTVVLLLISLFSFGQFPNNPTQSNVNTNNQFLGAATFQKGMVGGVFFDTTAMNAASYVSTTRGIICYSISDDAYFWRNGSLTKWIMIDPSGTPGTGNGWLIGGNNGLFTSPVQPQYIGTKTTQPFGFLTSNVARLTIPTTGIARTNDPAYKYLVFDTSGSVHLMGYADGGGGSTPTWQQTLTAGSTLTGNNTISGGGFDFTWNNNNTFTLKSITDILFETRAGAGSHPRSSLQNTTSTLTLRSYDDNGEIGDYRLPDLTNVISQSRLVGQDNGNGMLGYVTIGSGLALSGGQLSASGTGWGLTGNSGTNPSTNFVGTTDGVDFVLKANSTEFQRLVPYVGTDTGYFGYVINDNYVTTPAAFTAHITANGGASSTAVAGGRQLNASGSPFSQTFNIPGVWPSSVLPNETYRAVGIKTASNNGLVLAQEVTTTSLNYWARLWAEYDFNTRVVTIKIQNGGGVSTLATSSALSSIATGDSVACIFVWDYNQVSATMTNLNNSATITVTTGFTPPNYAPTIYNPCTFFPLTTNPTVLQSLQVYIQAYKTPDINFVGHSVLQGYGGVTRAQLVPELVRGFMPDYKIQVDAMGSMKIADVQYWMSEIHKISGDYVALMIGANDPGSVTNNATFYSGYRALRDSIINRGKKIIHFGQLPQSGYDFGPRNDSLKTLYGTQLGEPFIDIFPLLKNTVGFGYLPYYDVGDGIHPSAAGDSLIASQFMLTIAGLINKPVNQDYVDFSKILSLQKQAFYENPLIFNSDRAIPDKGYVDSVVANTPAALVLNSTTTTGFTNTYIPYNNNGVLGQYAITGTGSVAMSNSPTLVTPTLGVASGTSLTTSGIIKIGTDLGLGGTTPIPGPFGSVIQKGANGILWGNGTDFHLLNNAYNDGAWHYTANGAAMEILFNNGTMTYRTAPSGTAGAGLTWADVGIFNNDGSIGIGTASTSASAQLEVSSTTKGVLFPRMTQAQRTAISTPALGLMVYQTDGIEGVWINKSSGWIFGF